MFAVFLVFIITAVPDRALGKFERGRLSRFTAAIAAGRL